MSGVDGLVILKIFLFLSTSLSLLDQQKAWATREKSEPARWSPFKNTWSMYENLLNYLCVQLYHFQAHK